MKNHVLLRYCRDGRFFRALTIIAMFFITSCEKDNLEQDVNIIETDSITRLSLTDSNSVLFYGPETFMIGPEKFLDKVISLDNEDFAFYENFILKVENGIGGRTKVTKLEIRIDGIIVMTGKDFKRNARVASRTLQALTSRSSIEISLEGTEGRFISILIECTNKPGNITDIEGNTYRTVLIGEQVWMVDNLRTTKFNDGTTITHAPGINDWFNLADGYFPAFCWYNNDVTLSNPYGALYNWAAAGDERLCPEGWHLPDSQDFYNLCLYLDPDTYMGYYSGIAGGKLKEAGTTHWNSPNTGATNESGFTGLPGGHRNNIGLFVEKGEKGLWWSDNGLASMVLYYDDTIAGFTEGGNEDGHSVRCIKN